MFVAALTHTDFFGDALRNGNGRLRYQASPFPVVALDGSDAAFMVSSDCSEDRSFTLPRSTIDSALRLLAQGANPLWLVESAAGLQFSATAPAQVESDAPAPESARPGRSVPLDLNPLDSAARKAKAHGGVILRVGAFGLQLNTGISEWVHLECLEEETWMSFYKDGKLTKRLRFPALKMVDFLRAVPFDSIWF